MNSNLPPKIDEASRKSSQSSFLLGGLVGLVAGVVLAALFWVVVGTLFYRTSRVQSFPTQAVSVQPAPPTVITMAADRSTVAEIDAASRLSFEQNRVPIFVQIASRPTLSSEAQVHLVKAIFQHVSFENERLTPLLKLIANPAFSPAAKEAILNQLNGLAFEENRRTILEAIGKREK